MDKTAIVTGAAQGIGKAVALQFLAKGIKVVIVDYDQEALIAVEKELSTANALYLKADVAIETDVTTVINRTIEWSGNVTFLINNAGISEFSSLADTSFQQWLKVINTNLTSVFLFSKYCARALKKSKGRIVNISSTRAIMSEPENEAYAASKGGIISLTHALANSLSPEVLVNCISPGWIEVSEWKKPAKRKSPELTKQDHTQHLAGRVGKPEDVAELVYFLCEQQGGFITGQNFVIDGGMTKKMIYV